MTRFAFFALLLLSACQNDQRQTGAAAGEAAGAETKAEGKAEDGKVSIKGPGFDFKVDVPEGLSTNSDLRTDGHLLYPGASLSGVHIEAGDGRAEGDQSGVELSFTSSDAPDKLLGWYRDPARKAHFTLAPAAGAANAIAGTTKEGDPFTLSLEPGAGGGTRGRLLISDKG